MNAIDRNIAGLKGVIPLATLTVSFEGYPDKATFQIANPSGADRWSLADLGATLHRVFAELGLPADERADSVSYRRMQPGGVAKFDVQGSARTAYAWFIVENLEDGIRDEDIQAMVQTVTAFGPEM
jgi:hypothetical protein